MDINKAMTDTWAASGYDLTGMANHILVPHDIVIPCKSKISEAETYLFFNFHLKTT